MAVKSKVQLDIDIAASTFTAPQQTILGDIVDSYEDVFSQMTTVQRDALSPAPVAGQIIYNTDNDRYEYWDGAAWSAMNSLLSTITLKIQLSSADILALHTTDKVLVPAVGAGYAIMPTSISYRYSHVSAAYANGSNLIAFMNSKTYASSLVAISSDVVKVAANKSGGVSLSSDPDEDGMVENDSLVLGCQTAFITGDGTLTLWVSYQVLVY